MSAWSRLAMECARDLDWEGASLASRLYFMDVIEENGHSS